MLARPGHRAWHAPRLDAPCRHRQTEEVKQEAETDVAEDTVAPEREKVEHEAETDVAAEEAVAPEEKKVEHEAQTDVADETAAPKQKKKSILSSLT